jgi:hypothetical protein
LVFETEYCAAELFVLWKRTDRNHFNKKLLVKNTVKNTNNGGARSISVMPGDTINLTVYAKYVDPNNTNNTAALSQLVAQILTGTATAGTVIDGTNYSTNGITPFPYTGLAGEGNDTGTGPKAYMNYITFDRNFVPLGMLRMEMLCMAQSAKKLLRSMD